MSFVFAHTAPAHAAVTPWAEHEPVRVRLVVPWEVAPRSGELWLGFEVELAEGWHIYWKNSGDAGFPPVLDLRGTPPLSDVELLFPAPERYAVPGGLVAIGYEGRMVYPLRAVLDVPEAEALELALVADYLVCEEDCIPFHDELTLSLPLGEPVPDAAVLESLDSWRSRLPRPVAMVDGLTVGAVRQGDQLVVRVEGATASAEDPDLFFAPTEGFTLGAPVARRTEGGFRFRVPLAAADARQGLPETLPLDLVVTGLGSEDEPLAVASRLEVGPPTPAGVGSTRKADATRLVVGGALLGVAPSVLSLLGLLLLWPQREIRSSLGPLSEIWPFVTGSLTGFLLLGLGLHAWTRASGSPFFATPGAVVGAALPSLALTLWLWYGRPLRLRRPRSLGRDLLAGLLAPFLALPWFPAAGALAPVAVGRATPAEAALAAAGFALPFLLVGSWVTLRPRPESPARGPELARALGFVSVTSLVWVSYLLLDLMPTHRLAFVQLDWLLVGLGAHAATVASGRRRVAWGLAAATVAVASVALAAG